MVRNMEVCEKMFFHDGGQHGCQNSESNVSQLSFRIQRQIKCQFIYKVKVVEYGYVKINNISCIFSKMAAKMATENYNLMYLSSPFEYRDK